LYLADCAELEDAAEWIGINLSRWGRISVLQTKEKYGTARVYCKFGHNELSELFYPFCDYRPRLGWFGRIEWLPRIYNWLLVPYQQRLYRIIYDRALKKWGHLADEILSGADEPLLLRRVYEKYSIDCKWRYTDGSKLW